MTAATLTFHTKLRRWWRVKPLLTLAGRLGSVALARWAIHRLIVEARTSSRRRATVIGRWRLDLVDEGGQLSAVAREVWS